MSKFVQLQEKYQAEKAADYTYWANLHGMVHNIRSNFAIYLGVTPDQKINVDGEEVPVVASGLINDHGEFQRWAVEKLPRSELSLTFALRVAYGDVATECVKPVKAFSMKMHSLGDTFFVKVEGFPEAFKGPVFDSLYEALFNNTLRKIGVV
ncbi:hypothetical protein IRZ81_14430 [Pseudomonas putida]|uniref:hypothetical protein n=1 Tax=Pseudomonas putida TaxID=303 RepID=UPI0018AAF6DF|nr:hypothetical protein [Pseudomonas putida]MBF8651991.1 hypothetical protein [Pseudomonas putida]MBF8655943.1 hypothetical protein [Pseudomonas putida]